MDLIHGQLVWILFCAIFFDNGSHSSWKEWCKKGALNLNIPIIPIFQRHGPTPRLPSCRVLGNTQNSATISCGFPKCRCKLALFGSLCDLRAHHPTPSPRNSHPSAMLTWTVGIQRGLDSSFNLCAVPTYYCASEYFYNQCPGFQKLIWNWV